MNIRSSVSKVIRLAGYLAVMNSALGVLAAQEGWTRFRGPNGQGIAVDARPPLEWSESKNLVWRLQLPGPGASSPICAGDNLLVTCYSGFGVSGSTDGNIADLVRHVVCVDAATGKQRWAVAVKSAGQETRYTRLTEHGYASHTPVTDGERVYVFFGQAGVYAFDLTGKQLWQADVGKGSGRQAWGSAASPVLYKNSVIVTAADESQSIRALDKDTGKELWKAEGAALENVYNTPVLLSLPDGHQELVVTVQNEVWGLNPDTGKLRWFATAPCSTSLAASIVTADGIVYASGGNRSPGMVAIRAGGKGDVSKTHVLWSSARGSDFGSPILHEGHLYFANSRGSATCLNAKNGELVYEERVRLSQGSARIYASPVLADGKLFIPTRTAGSVVLAAKPAFAQLAENEVAGDRSDFSATPMVIGKRLFLRSNWGLYCFAEASK